MRRKFTSTAALMIAQFLVVVPSAWSQTQVECQDSKQEFVRLQISQAEMGKLLEMVEGVSYKVQEVSGLLQATVSLHGSFRLKSGRYVSFTDPFVVTASGHERSVSLKIGDLVDLSCQLQ